jgi:hypothetical protein
VTGDHAVTGQRKVGLEAKTSIDGVDPTGPTSGDGWPNASPVAGQFDAQG